MSIKKDAKRDGKREAKKQAASFQPLTDVTTINILICCFLYKTRQKITREELKDILVDNDIVNYFFFSESISYLFDNDSVAENEEGQLILKEKGVECARKLGSFTSHVYLEKADICASVYYARKRMKKQVDIDYTPNEEGFCVRVVLKGEPCDLVDLKFQVATERQAKTLCDAVRKNPIDFYSKLFKAFDTVEMGSTIKQLKE
jgi:hypothetical protein